MFVRKARAGATSLGYVWERDGQVLEVADEHGFELLAIRDGGFSEVHPSEVVPDPEPSPADVVTEPDPVNHPVVEPDEAAAVTEPEPASDVVEAPAEEEPAEPVTEPVLVDPTPAAEEKPKRAPRQAKAKDTPAK